MITSFSKKKLIIILLIINLKYVKKCNISKKKFYI